MTLFTAEHGLLTAKLDRKNKKQGKKTAMAQMKNTPTGKFPCADILPELMRPQNKVLFRYLAKLSHGAVAVSI